jgi:hypothetical protein
VSRLGRAVGLLAALLGALAACGGPAPVGPRAPNHGTTRSLGAGRPRLAVIARDGDAESAVAVAVDTEGIAPDRGAMPGVALAALVEARLRGRRARDAGDGSEAAVRAVGGWGGWRLRALATTPANAAELAASVREAMLAPVTDHDPALPDVLKKVEALTHRPLPDRALAPVAQCTGEAWGLDGEAMPTEADLETWRQAAHGTGRVAFAVAGADDVAIAVADTLARAGAWPAAQAARPTPWPPPEQPAVAYDASSEIAAGSARIVLTARTASPDRVVQIAGTLGDPRGPLASRLAALDAPGRIESVVATAHPDGGCLAVTIDLSARDLQRLGPPRIATAAALARQEATVEIAEPSGEPRAGDAGDGREVLTDVATQAADPRDAAERAAWWSLAAPRTVAGEDLRVSLYVGLAASRDAGATATLPGDAIRAEIDRATMAWHTPVVEARVRVERGQGETWVLLASPCGTLGEAADAGSGAAAAYAAGLEASDVGSGGGGGDARIEPFVSAEGVGVIAHGPRRGGESAPAQARRLADLAARAFAAQAPASGRVDQARAALAAQARASDALVFGTASAALTQGHPSWLVPLGVRDGLGSLSDDDVAARAAALRAGPLRVAVMASEDRAQADVAVRAVDRWVARRPGEARACAAVPSVHPRPGTYAVDLPPGAAPVAILALPLAPDAASRSAATELAAALDGPDGWLARALGGNVGDGAGPLAGSWRATVVGPLQAQALAIRVTANEGSLDAAVAQVRGLLDRLRQGAIKEEDLARATRTIGRAALSASLDPRQRIVALWRGASNDATSAPPALDALRAWTASALRDDGLVIVAARPPRADGRSVDGRGRDPRK